MDGVQNPQSQGSQNQNSQRKTSRPNFAAGASSTQKRGPSLSSKVLVGVLVLVGLVIVIALTVNAFGIGKDKLVNENQYQAVFLQNGQVYFGKLEGLNDPYLKLTDIYYLQVTQAQGDDGEEQLQPAGQQQQISLAKLGNELHGPEDTMYIAQDKVLFWENLKDEGQVTQAINDYQAQQGNGGNQNQNQNADGGNEGGEEQ